MTGVVGQRDERRDRRLVRPLHFRDDRADAGTSADRDAVAARPAAHALVAVVIVDAADDRADDGELVHLRGDPRKAFADLDAGDFGRDRAELAANFLRGLGLDFPHVLMRRAAGEEDVDHRLLSRLLR